MMTKMAIMMGVKTLDCLSGHLQNGKNNNYINIKNHTNQIQYTRYYQNIKNNNSYKHIFEFKYT